MLTNSKEIKKPNDGLISQSERSTTIKALLKQIESTVYGENIGSSAWASFDEATRQRILNTPVLVTLNVK